MRSSSVLRIVLGLAMAGCAHTAAPPPSPAPAKAPPATATPARSTAGEPIAGGGRSADPRLDPSEEITAEELASIPEPVPGGSPAPSATAPSATAPSATAPSTAAPEPATPGTAWRVQIFASPDLAAADSVAKAASALFEAPYAIEFEGSLYKVRLGSFASEQEAQALRERAVRSGFPGAFRVRSVTR